jgi:parallel beta-helix repeat protein
MIRSPLRGCCALAAGIAFVLQGCSSDHMPTAPAGGRVVLAATDASTGDGRSAQANGRAPIFVDDGDRADCPQAQFTSIQAAVEAAEPGDRILVCRGTYEESVLVEKADLRIEAQGAPGDVVLQGPGTGPYGFHLRRTTGVLVQGFTVQGYGDANIIVAEGGGNTIRKNVATAGIVDGIEVLRSSGNLIEHNVAYANTAPNADGIFVSQVGSHDNVIRNNESYANGQHGINLFQSGPGNVVSGNRSHDNRGRGIQSVQGSNGNVIEDNHAYANGLIPGGPPIMGGGIGILVVASSGVTIRHNRSDGNGAGGIGLTNATNTVVSNNRSENNALAGIQLNGSSGNRIEENKVFRNGQDGVRVTNNADRNVIQLNEILWNIRDGIRVVDGASDENTLERNLIRHSTELDARDGSVGSGTSGTANFWIRNHCASENVAGLCASPPQGGAP